MSHASGKTGYMAVIYYHYLCIAGVVYNSNKKETDYIPLKNLYSLKNKGNTNKFPFENALKGTGQSGVGLIMDYKGIY